MTAVASQVMPPLADTGAPVALITGLPGSGKTLFALAEFAVGKGQVYQWGIDGCALPTCEPDKWATLPKGSTLIVDEAWKYFPPKNPNADPPEHYKIGEIRHTGVSLVLISQHPSDLDARIRRRVGRHIHVVRIFGAEESVLHQKNEVFDVESRADTVTRRWVYPKKVFALYKSAELHRQKEAKPWRYRLIPLMWAGVPVLLVAGLWYTFHSPSHLGGPVAASRAVAGGVGAMATAGGVKGPPPLSWVDKRQPRIAGLAYSAPVYDEVTTPKDAPYPAACVQSVSKGCTCYSQQGTILATGADVCKQIVAKGFFIDWKSPKPDAPGAPVYRAAPEPAPWVAQPAPPEPAPTAAAPGTPAKPEPFTARVVSN